MLIGSRTSLSTPVVLGLAITAALLSSMYVRLIPGESPVQAVSASIGAAVVATAVLLIARTLIFRQPTRGPHVGLVMTAVIVSSLARSFVTTEYVHWRTGGLELDSRPLLRVAAAIVVTLVAGLIMAAAAQLAHERSEALAELVRDQARLKLLLERADAELTRSEAELRTKARAMLEPSIEEIRVLIAGEVSSSAAQQVSDHISAVVREIVRPASHALAHSTGYPITAEAIDANAIVPFLKDRIDITKAIRPVWLIVAWWGVLIPGPLITGLNGAVWFQRFMLSLVTIPVMFGLKAAWPPRLRTMPVSRALVVLFVFYCLLNIGFDILMTALGKGLVSSEPWTGTSPSGIAIRVALGMLVSILAILAIRGEQTRETLRETNTLLQAHIARLTRETWLLHRSVSLAVHGTVQSALVSTAMRLTATDRTPASIAEASDRLERALTAISTGQADGGSLKMALEDLKGLWAPTVEISFDVAREAQQHLDVDTGLRQCVIEICREAISNAIRHGHAKHVALHVASVESLIEITASDDGDGVGNTVRPGLGAAMLDSTCLRWDLSPGPVGGSVMVAVLS